MSLKPVPAVLRLAVFLLSLSILSGCDDAREKIASAISPATAAEVTANVSRQIGAGQFQQAIEEGESYLASNADASGKLAWELAKASAQAKDADRAVRYASAAIQAGAASSVELMSEPLLEPVRTDLRMVSLAAGMSPRADGAAAASPAQAQQPVATGDAQATIGEQGVSASAGDVSVKLPD